MERNDHPFTLSTAASLNLSDDGELVNLMVRTGFESVFVGTESPNVGILLECRKIPNKNCDLLGSVRAVQRSGIQVF